MVRLIVSLCVICLLGLAGGWGGVAFAQDGRVAAPATHKAHAKKVQSKGDVSEDWAIAAPKAGSSAPRDMNEDPKVAAGRKKFFSKSWTAVDGPPGAPTGGGDTFTPSMGFSF